MLVRLWMRKEEASGILICFIPFSNSQNHPLWSFVLFHLCCSVSLLSYTTRIVDLDVLHDIPGLSIEWYKQEYAVVGCLDGQSACLMLILFRIY